MPTFDHLTLPVADWIATRDWYRRKLGLKVEFDVQDRRTVAMVDSNGFTIFFEQALGPVKPFGVALYFQVPDLEISHRALLAENAILTHGPRQTFWGFGIELVDPDGYIVRLWDKRMTEP